MCSIRSKYNENIMLLVAKGLIKGFTDIAGWTRRDSSKGLAEIRSRDIKNWKGCWRSKSTCRRKNEKRWNKSKGEGSKDKVDRKNSPNLLLLLNHYQCGHVIIDPALPNTSFFCRMQFSCPSFVILVTRLNNAYEKPCINIYRLETIDRKTIRTNNKMKMKNLHMHLTE